MGMKLTQLLQNVTYERIKGETQREVRAVVNDSRKA